MSNVSPLKNENTERDATVDYVDLAKKTLKDLQASHPDQDLRVEITQGYDKMPRVVLDMKKPYESQGPSTSEKVLMGVVGVSILAGVGSYVYSVFQKTKTTDKK